MPQRPLTLRRAALSGAAIAASIVVLGPVGAPLSTASAAPRSPRDQRAAGHHDATVSSTRVPSAPAARRALTVLGRPDSPKNLMAELPSKRTPDFGMVGVTWDRATGTGTVDVQVRTHAKGVWSSWSPLEVDENGAEGTRAGTEPRWVGSADGVAARVRATGGTAPKGIRIEMVDPGTDPVGPNSGSTDSDSTDSNARSTVAAAEGSPAYTPKPTLISRTAWGARKNKYCDSPRYGSHTSGVIFHHTADTNSYAKSRSKSIVRATQAYHMQGRGWCDIGYNFLVDKYGQIFEGRSGGVSHPVRGAHAGNRAVNTYAMGVSMMGNLDRVRPSTAMKNAAVRLIGWRLGTNFLPAKGTYAIAGRKLNRISGHRDVRLSGIRPATATACPGRYGYAWMKAKGGLRDRVAAYISKYTSPIKTRAAKLRHSTLGYLYIGEYRTSGGRKALFTNGDIYSKGSLGAHLVSGPVRTEYGTWGRQSGALGFPSSDLVADGSNATQRFEHGSIYRMGSSTAFGLTSGVDDEYQSLGGFDSELGVPTSRVTTTSGIDNATFAGGTISYNRSTGEATVTYN